ncbi:zinc carboxypeptidase-like [Ceratina calcarata]|uniref:Zinc carboxypeptidase A 1 n=1 Tax=Ceratina calcarata TaxID=156304 RepID=A0AAJ7RVU1_9HYME|nr:zinc carboxypeptidase-like [Ceratina calcarata]
MIEIFLCFTLLLGSVCSADDEKVRYDGYKVYKLFVPDVTKYELVKNMQDDEGYHFWVPPKINDTATVMIKPAKIQEFMQIANTSKLELELMMDDLQKLIDEENPRDDLRGTFNWFSYHRLDIVNGGTSPNPCSETYPGDKPFSETETRTMSEYIGSIQDKIFAYIAFHSYSQLLLIPYGHTNKRIENYNDLLQIGNYSINALAKRYGTKYRVGNIVDVIYVASGGSMDWVRGTYKTPVTFTYELRDRGRYAFMLPANQIIPTAEETLDSLVAMFQQAAKLGYGSSTGL